MATYLCTDGSYATGRIHHQHADLVVDGRRVYSTWTV